jgi:hypothetical protein
MFTRYASRLIAIASTAIAAMLGYAASPAMAQPAGPALSSSSPALAIFEGQVIALDGDPAGWGEAKVCVVSRALSKSTCFRTEAEAAKFRASLRGVSNGSAGETGRPMVCAHPLYLWEDGRASGRKLQFCDSGYWQNLKKYNFDNKMSSYQTGDCSARLADGEGGSGDKYPGNTGPHHYEGVLSDGWNDRVSSIYLC